MIRARSFRRPLAFLRRFRADESGSVTVEAILMVPMLVWCYLATLVFFDSFRTQSVNIKASYTIGDMLSRETGYVTANYLSGLYNLQGLLLATSEPRALQITAYSFNAAQNRYVVRWSRGMGGLPDLTTADLAVLRPMLPTIPDAEVAILTRSRVDYAPVYDVGLRDFTFDEYTVTRPRFVPQLCWNSRENGTASTATC